MTKTKNKRLLISKQTLAGSILALTAFGVPQVAFPAMTEEQRLIQIARTLKPISDSQWNEIAGSKITDTYDIQKGDTLWDISKRLFGNSYYWPKVWALNASITNPHVVEPGQKLSFTSGSSEATPTLAPAAGTNAPNEGGAPQAASNAPPASPAVAHEYQKLSPDMWKPVEVGVIQDKKQYDDYGMDRDLKVVIPSRFSFRVPEIANDTTVPYLGEILTAQVEGAGITEHQSVFIKSNSQDLQVGTTYSIFDEPEFTHEKKSDRSGYIYRTIGEVQIVGVKDDLYVGMVTRAHDIITRGMKIYPLLPSVTDMKPLPARTAIESLAIISTDDTISDVSQYQIVHFDRGIEDGVQIGNVFRIYDYYDPYTRKKITDSDLLIEADALVIHATAQFSTAIIVRAVNLFTSGDFAVLLTDVSDLEKQMPANTEHSLTDSDKTDQQSDKELDELDELDKSTGEGLGTKEEAEIKELDQWDKKKDVKDDTEEEPTMPSAADTPTDDAEKMPSTNPVPKNTPKDPTLDDMLDSPTVTPPGVENGAPPRKGGDQEQTLEAPPPPTSSDEPPAQPIEPQSGSGGVDPAMPAPSDQVPSQ